MEHLDQSPGANWKCKNIWEQGNPSDQEVIYSLGTFRIEKFHDNMYIPKPLEWCYLQMQAITREREISQYYPTALIHKRAKITWRSEKHDMLFIKPIVRHQSHVFGWFYKHQECTTLYNNIIICGNTLLMQINILLATNKVIDDAAYKWTWTGQ